MTITLDRRIDSITIVTIIVIIIIILLHIEDFLIEPIVRKVKLHPGPVTISPMPKTKLKDNKQEKNLRVRN